MAPDPLFGVKAAGYFILVGLASHPETGGEESKREASQGKADAQQTWHGARRLKAR
jgi:hypothetical protein